MDCQSGTARLSHYVVTSTRRGASHAGGRFEAAHDISRFSFCRRQRHWKRGQGLVLTHTSEAHRTNPSLLEAAILLQKLSKSMKIRFG